MIRIWEVMKEGKGAPDCCRQLSLCACVYAVGMATWSDTVRPPDLPRNPLPLPRCAAFVSGLFVGGQEGGITPGMIPYYWARLPFRLGLLLLAGSGLLLLPVLQP